MWIFEKLLARQTEGGSTVLRTCFVSFPHGDRCSCAMVVRTWVRGYKKRTDKFHHPFDDHGTLLFMIQRSSGKNDMGSMKAKQSLVWYTREKTCTVHEFQNRTFRLFRMLILTQCRRHQNPKTPGIIPGTHRMSQRICGRPYASVASLTVHPIPHVSRS